VPDILKWFLNSAAQVKCGLLRETSPTLNDISSVLSWEKINDGLCRMYLVG